MFGNFERCFALTETWEGWRKFSNDPRDPGGKTFSGVTQRVWDAWCDRKGLVRSDVRAMSDEHCAALYREQFWRAVRADELPAGVDCLAYDLAVNAGPGRAIRILQAALGVPADGHLGVATLAAAGKADPRAVIQAMHNGRLGFWRRLPTWAAFGRGWSNRERDIRTHALAMVRAPLAARAA